MRKASYCLSKSAIDISTKRLAKMSVSVGALLRSQTSLSLLESLIRDTEHLMFSDGLILRKYGIIQAKSLCG